jgi:hypothetical protein
MTFTSKPFSESVEILGTPEVELTVTTDRPYGMVAARLLVIDPEGNSHLICRGNRNLVFPDSLSDPQPPSPGERLQIRFPLMSTSVVIPAGWRIRLAIAGADFPVVWPPPGRFTITIDPAESRLLLPSARHDHKKREIYIPASQPPPTAPVEFVEDEATWSLEHHDHQTTFARRIISRQIQPTRGDLNYSSDQTWTVVVDDDDPGTTEVRSSSDLTLSRPGWDVAVAAGISIGGTDALKVIIDLAARYNGAEVWRRNWEEEIPRKWV